MYYVVGYIKIYRINVKIYDEKIKHQLQKNTRYKKKKESKTQENVKNVINNRRVS